MFAYYRPFLSVQLGVNEIHQYEVSSLFISNAATTLFANAEAITSGTFISARARVSSAIPGGSALSGWPVERASAGG